MIIRAQGGPVELTEEALVVRRKKGDRVLPYDTISSVEVVPARSWISPGSIRPILVGDPTRATSAISDKNSLTPSATSAQEREEVAAFARELQRRVEAAVVKRTHPRIEELASDPAALRRARTKELQTQERLARYAEVRAAEAKAVEALAAEDPQLDARIAQALDAAARHAAAHEVEWEYDAIRKAHRIAREQGGRRFVGLVDARVAAMRSRGAILIGSHRLGSVAPEGRMNAASRTTLGSLLVDGGKEIEVHSDRVIQGPVCKPIDPQTTATVYLDGEQQVISTNPFNSRRQNLDDRRRAEFQVAGAGWSMRVAIHPDETSGPRRLAAQINAAAAELGARGPSAVVTHAARPARPAAAHASPSARPAEPDAPATHGASVIEQLERLQVLLQSGAVDQAEFTALKGAILSGVR